ncbi:MAG: Asp23/Gls24 family envelope stress response protein [Candidatus Omnitrophota bacterium]
MKKRVFWSVHEEEKIKEDHGFLKINNKAIISIARLAALEVKGVSRMGRNILHNIQAIFCRKLYHNGVLVEFNQENELIITLYIIAEYGANLPELANEVKHNVRSALERMAEIVPLDVNVIIQRVEKK